MKLIIYIFSIFAFANTSLVGSEQLDVYHDELLQLATKSKLVGYYDSNTKKLKSIRGNLDDSMVKHYKKFFENDTKSCLFIVVRDGVFSGKKSIYVWGNEKVIKRHDGRNLDGSIDSLAKALKSSLDQPK